jgi:hypothetical protein
MQGAGFTTENIEAEPQVEGGEYCEGGNEELRGVYYEIRTSLA